ncbi:hypothetical protein DFH29DRAFT_45568 [Suillus ampliporus]|nr:hypothetical protein DFH29DRAFT_45568 [Suillus ampliporus]
MREWTRLETDQLSQSLSEPKCTPQKFSGLFYLLSSLIPHFVPPSSYLPLVLHHPDLALRNVFFYPTDNTKIVGLVDWDGAQILPLVLTAKFPDDLNSTGEDPVRDKGSPLREGTSTVSHDLASFSNTSKCPKVFRGTNDQVDSYERCVQAVLPPPALWRMFAQENHDRYCDYDPGRAMSFAHALYYLKFHEIMTGGWTAWVDHAEWIRL